MAPLPTGRGWVVTLSVEVVGPVPEIVTEDGVNAVVIVELAGVTEAFIEMALVYPLPIAESETVYEAEPPAVTVCVRGEGAGLNAKSLTATEACANGVVTPFAVKLGDTVNCVGHCADVGEQVGVSGTVRVSWLFAGTVPILHCNRPFTGVGQVPPGDAVGMPGVKP